MAPNVKASARSGRVSAIPVTSALHPSNQRKRQVSITQSRYFEIKIIRPVMEQDVKVFKHVGDMYLHFLDGLLVRQLEVFHTQVNPTRWSVRLIKEDDPAMYAFSVESIGRFRSHEISLTEFERMWTVNAGPEGLYAAQRSPFLAPLLSRNKDREFSLGSPHMNTSSTEVNSARGSISSWTQTLTAESRSLKVSASDMGSNTLSPHGSIASMPSPLATPPPRPPRSSPVAHFSRGNSTEAVAQELASDVHMIEMETIDLNPARPPKTSLAAAYDIPQESGEGERGGLLAKWSPFNSRKQATDAWVVGEARV